MQLSGLPTDSRSGPITGDFVISRSSGHEGRGAGKIDLPGGREKHAYFFCISEKILQS